jgi:hypothetical protein
MKTKRQVIIPKYLRIFDQLGENIKLRENVETYNYSSFRKSRNRPHHTFIILKRDVLTLPLAPILMFYGC